LLNSQPCGSKLSLKLAQNVLRTRTITFTVANGIQSTKWIGSTAFAILSGAAKYLVQTLVTRRNTLSDTAGTLVQATACFGFTMTNGFQSIQWIGAATRAIAGGAPKHFVKTSVTRRLAWTFSNTAGTLANASTGCYHRICFTVTNGIQRAKWIGTTAFAIRAGAAKYFVQSLVT
jgi:hypothetical protein